MTSVPPTQPPAAPETDVSALREALEAADLPWRAAEQTHGTWYGIQSPYFALGNVFNETDARLIVAAVNALPALLADLTAARERVRVVEGERDAARREARGEEGSDATAGEPRDQCTHIARAESAEAAHRALVAKLTAHIGAIEATHGDESLDIESLGLYGVAYRECAADLRALLAGGAR